jgi:cytochrome c biogenesis protein CcdA/thiol-disulfide isomerase/thioredoxin
VLVLIGIGLAAGIITAVSPCVLPVLPLLLAGGVAGRRPLRIIAGLVASFTVFTLFAAWLLDKLGLPQDFLRNLAIALLFVVAATLLVPRLGELLERPFSRLTRRSGGERGGGFVLGASLGLVFVPCAGPVLAAISVVAANQHVGWRAIVLTLSYALGAALPMLAIAFGGRALAARLRAQGPRVRVVSGLVIAATAFLILFHVDEHFTTALPGYTASLQDTFESSGTAQRELAKLRPGQKLVAKDPASSLPDYGPAPALVAGGRWFNSAPLTMRALRGKVVLIDFWTYSCINCLRTLPHLTAWDAKYRKDGLVIVGVHTPEFAFEHVASNVARAIKRYGIRYPVVQDNDYGTWNNYANQYWPAEYLIDRQGHVRHAKFGEGDYPEGEKLLRRLLGVDGGAMTTVRDTTPSGLLTPESYLGSDRATRFATELHPGAPFAYSFPEVLRTHELAYGGVWTVLGERAVAVRDAKLRLHFNASKVYLVLGGKGTVRVRVEGRERSVKVDGDRLYTLFDERREHDALLELSFTPGVAVYAFTFG